MSHLDEGTLHALLDGELELAEVREIQMHLGTCAACGSRLQDVKQFLAEADRLVGTLQTPGGATRIPSDPPRPLERPSEPAVPSDPPRTAAEPPPPIPPRPLREPQPWEAPPQILLPEPPDMLARRRMWMRGLRWAAMIVVIVGAGRLLSNAMGPSRPKLELNERDLSSAAPASPPAVVSPQERGRPEPPVPQPPVARQTRPAPVKRAPVPKPAPEPKVLADAPASDSARDQLDSASTVAEDSAPQVQQTVAAAARRPDSGSTGQLSGDEEAATRRAAAAALAELDRERLRSRANAATAALPPPRTETPAAPEAPPPPRTLEQRAQVYLRIGLDEASKQLGRPVHVIEAMTSEFIGLTQGKLVPGADPSRPVVRVVYLDRGRLVMLDQQRMPAGQAPGAASGSLRWALGDLMLYLHGDPGTEALRVLQRRVR